MTISVRSATTALVIAALLATPTAGAQTAEETAELPMMGNWSGVFRNVLMTQESRNAAGAVIGRISGTVDLQPYHESGMDLYQVVIQLSTNTPGQDLEWGVSMGRCGSKLIMVEGEIRHSVALNLIAQATYQVGIFRNGHAQQNMIACANLKYDTRMR